MIETIDGLCEFAKSHGYTNEDRELLKQAHAIASEFSKGKIRFRNQSRPFINHLISVSAILMTASANIETVVAGLLHSVKNDMPRIYTMNPTVGEIVENYFDITVGPIEITSFKNLSLIKSAVITIQMANTADMILAKELA
jgi:(p)ppGpp synthase/HD superfamily hydrolase